MTAILFLIMTSIKKKNQRNRFYFKLAQINAVAWKSLLKLLYFLKKKPFLTFDHEKKMMKL